MINICNVNFRASVLNFRKHKRRAVRAAAKLALSKESGSGEDKEETAKTTGESDEDESSEEESVDEEENNIGQE